MGRSLGWRVLVTMLLAAFVGVQAGAVLPAAAVTAEDERPRFLSGQRELSPSGDGRRERVTLRYRLKADGPVQLRIGVGRTARKGFTPYVVRLGKKPAGRHAWTWDGRDRRGRVVPHGPYRITLSTPQGRALAYVDVDRKFEAGVAVAERYGAPGRQVPKVYPRSRVVRDAVRLQAIPEAGTRRGKLTIRNAAGRVVARRALRSLGNEAEMAWEARDRRGRPLPPGRYVARVSGTDAAGNSGSGKPLRLWVSRDRLTWREETRTLTAQQTHVDSCDWSGTPECYEFPSSCGEVSPSTRLPGGMTHRTVPCDDPERPADAVSAHFVPVPDAVRGVDAVRVAFSGEPTVPGTVATGNLNAGGTASDPPMVSSSTGGRTDWVQDPHLGSGRDRDPDEPRAPRVPAGAFWVFWNDGPNAFDVGTFTLDLRYLAVLG
ncbi:FlgD immunoglobulin-like domain containing protein [Nocardioides campestrisoli]|uniref:FlgD immunoglobulin-like domain containing protein n=1 Tax=Nocardioides campestrisoli TaxID=2736757 RepID=UPI00163D4A68|nr:FlgD immunoglobulin-like domain containing protein [Nocardioides campestrisoli]